MNVFKEMGCAVAKVSAYPRFLQNKKGKVFGYGVLLITIYFIIAYLIPFAAFMMRIGGIGAAFEEYIPDFQLSAGTLWVEEPFYFDTGSEYVDIDTSMYFDVDEASAFAGDYSSVIILDAEKVFLKNDGEIQLLYYSDLGELELSKADLLGIVPMIYGIFIAAYLFLYLGVIGLFFFGVIFIALLGLILGSVLRVNLTFGQTYMLAIYSRTLSLAIKAIVKLTGIAIPMFWVLNFGLSLVYLFLALKQVKKCWEQQEQSSYYEQGGYDQQVFGQPEEQKNDSQGF